MKTTQAQVKLNDPRSVLEALSAHMAEHEAEISESDGAAVASLRSGVATLRVAHDVLSVEARASNEAQLEDLTRFLAAHVLEFAEPERPRIEWEGLKVGEPFADFREIEVAQVHDLTAHMRRITFRGDDLARFATDDNLHVRLFFPLPGQHPLWPLRGLDGLMQPVPPERKPAVRKYTIRRIDAAAGALDIDFVLHDDPGPGSDWARRAGRGDRIGMAGPGGLGAKPADWMLLAGDETALPAIARILESLPVNTKGRAIVVVDEAGDEIPLTCAAGIEIRWIHRTSSPIDFVSAVLAQEIPGTGSRFCWAAAEFDQIQSIRRYWRDEVGLAKDEQLAVAYWRKGEVGK